jgi:hypothetical protein
LSGASGGGLWGAYGSIIFSLIERAQFLVNEPVYQKGAIPVPVYNPHSGERYTFLEFFLRENEQLWGKVCGAQNDLPYLCT